jgi:hypothetical protein
MRRITNTNNATNTIRAGTLAGAIAGILSVLLLLTRAHAETGPCESSERTLLTAIANATQVDSVWKLIEQRNPGTNRVDAFEVFNIQSDGLKDGISFCHATVRSAPRPHFQATIGPQGYLTAAGGDETAIVDGSINVSLWNFRWGQDGVKVSYKVLPSGEVTFEPFGLGKVKEDAPFKIDSDWQQKWNADLENAMKMSEQQYPNYQYEVNNGVRYNGRIQSLCERRSQICRRSVFYTDAETGRLKEMEVTLSLTPVERSKLNWGLSGVAQLPEVLGKVIGRFYCDRSKNETKKVCIDARTKKEYRQQINLEDGEWINYPEALNIPMAAWLDYEPMQRPQEKW